MMFLRYIILLLLPLTCLNLSVLRAQNLPQMPSDPNVRTDVLPNGMRYYVAEVSGPKGMADFAVVGRRLHNKSQADSLDVYRSILVQLPRFKGLVPQSFFLSNGDAPDAEGYLRREENAISYNISNVRIGAKKEILDSALLVAVAMADCLSASDGDATGQKTSDVAVIVAGDINSSEVVEKLKTLSLFTAYGPSSSDAEYIWNGDIPSEYKSLDKKGISELNLVWRMPRTPKEYMGTTQPVIYNLMIGQMGLIAEKRLKDAFRKESLPYTQISYSHLSSAKTFSDEEFKLSVGVSAANVEKAAKIISRTLGNLDEFGVTPDEMRSAKREYLDVLTCPHDAQREEYVQRCIDSFLRSSSLSSAAQTASYFTAREINDSTEVRLLNTMLSSLLDSRKNLSFVCSGNKDPEVLRMIFEDNWNSGLASVEKISTPDTLMRLSCPYSLKQKLSRKDHFSGGTTWTFSNGMKVIYKKMETSGKLYWSMGFGDGYGSVSDLNQGEGAFFADYFQYCRVAGMRWNDFMGYLSDNGIKIDVEVDAAHTTLKGECSKDKLPLLMRSIRAIATETRPDDDEFEYYFKKQWLEIASSENEKGVIDSLMFPENRYTEFKMPGKLSRETKDKCRKFYEDLFSTMNLGLLVIVSDADGSVIRKELSRSLAAFPVGENSFSLPAVRSQPVSGWSTCVVEGDKDKIYMSLSILLSLTSVNAITANISGKLFQDMVAKEMAGCGMSLEADMSLTTMPNERFNITIALDRIDVAGLGADVHMREISDVLQCFRNSVDKVLSTEVTQEQLDVYKAWYKDKVARDVDDPCFWTSAILTRYIDGKDYLTGFDEKVDLVTTKGVEHIFNALATSSRVEYIIKKD